MGPEVPMRMFQAGSYIAILVLIQLVQDSGAQPQSMFGGAGALKKAMSKLEHVRPREPENVTDGKKDSGEQWYCEQLQDHFAEQTQSPRASTTWCQRYFVNATWHKKGGPVLLCVGGEGPAMEDDVLYDSSHCQAMVKLAPQIGAMMFALEHRFYGQSSPGVANLSTENLQGLLSSQQALADMAQFHRFAKKYYSLSGAWVTFGGSYPGMLAGFARQKYPKLFHASVSSSAPVVAQLNFTGYLDVAAAALQDPRVGGSTACASVITTGHAQIGETYETGGTSLLEAKFNLCGPDALSSRENFAQWVGFGVISIDIQGNDPECSESLCNIAKICSAVLEVYRDSIPTVQNREMEALATIALQQNSGTCKDVSFDSYMELLANVSLDNWYRVWQYQTCNEFGFYQTCLKGSNCPFTQGYSDVAFNVDPCMKLFGISREQVQANIDHANKYYGGDTPDATRILYVNGDVDPWHYLSVLVSPGPMLPTLWVPGDSHHFWTHSLTPNSSVYNTRAVHSIWDYVKAWLKVPTDRAGFLQKRDEDISAFLQVALPDESEL